METDGGPLTINSLLLCRDAETMRLLRRVLAELGIHVLVSTGCAEAGEMIARRKFDAIIIDCDDISGAPELLRWVRQGKCNKDSLAFVLVNGSTSTRAAFDLGANFVLEKPLTYENASRSFRGSHEMLVRERRRYYRHQVELPVLLEFDGDIYGGTIVNLSEGGVAVQCGKKIPAASRVRVNFALPGKNSCVICAHGEVAWNNGEKAGIRLVLMSDVAKQDLTSWITSAVSAQPAAARLPVPTTQSWAKPGN